MAGPHVTTRVKQHLHRSCRGVNARQIGALMQIAVITRQGQIVGRIRPAMLLGNDMVHMEERKGLLRLQHAAIFTTVTGTLTHQAACCGVDHAGIWLNKRRALACSTLMNSIAATAVAYSARSSADNWPAVLLSAR